MWWPKDGNSVLILSYIYHRVVDMIHDRMFYIFLSMLISLDCCSMDNRILCWENHIDYIILQWVDGDEDDDDDIDDDDDDEWQNIRSFNWCAIANCESMFRLQEGSFYLYTLLYSALWQMWMGICYICLFCHSIQ